MEEQELKLQLWSFWWNPLLVQQQQNHGMEQVGQLHLQHLNTARDIFSGAGSQTLGLAFGGYMQQLLQVQQNYGMEHLGLLIQIVCLQLDKFIRSRNSSCRFSFWWISSTLFNSNRRIYRPRRTTN
jgi:hypothetical protein